MTPFEQQLGELAAEVRGLRRDVQTMTEHYRELALEVESLRSWRNRLMGGVGVFVILYSIVQLIVAAS